MSFRILGPLPSGDIVWNGRPHRCGAIFGGLGRVLVLDAFDQVWPAGHTYFGHSIHEIFSQQARERGKGHRADSVARYDRQIPFLQYSTIRNPIFLYNIWLSPYANFFIFFYACGNVHKSKWNDNVSNRSDFNETNQVGHGLVEDF